MPSLRKTTIITDPIHQVMNLGSDPDLRKVLQKVIDTREFQRLRRITQLGLTSYVFPGATHTRFSHSLGVTYLAHSVLTHLREWAEDEATRKEINAVFNEVIMAALLHDIGHGPFSHSFELVLKEYSWAPLHEDWTATLITSPNSKIQQNLSGCGIDINRVASVFQKDQQSPLPTPFRQIVSSQIDVDRMDYLLRDSHFAGVAIGRFDAHYLINSMVIVSHTESSRTLGLTPKGVKAYEAFLLARQLMNRTLYYHHNVKVLEFTVEHLLRLVVSNLQALVSDTSVAPLIPAYFRKVSDTIQRPPQSKQSFIRDTLREYIALTEDAVWVLIAAVADSPTVPLAQSLAQRLLTRQILPHFLVEPGKTGLLREALLGSGLHQGTEFHLLDLKTTMYKANGDERVFVVDWDGTIEEVAERSETITAFRDRPEAESLLIVIDEAKLPEIEALAKSGQFIVPRRSPNSAAPADQKAPLSGR